MYKGRYKREAVAVKEFLTSAQAEHTGDTLDDHHTNQSEDDDVIRQEEALFLFRYVGGVSGQALSFLREMAEH